MKKRFLILTLAAAIAAATADTALAGKPAILLPGGTYLNQAATFGLSCLGSSATSGVTTFIVSVPSSQSDQGVTFQVDYSFDPDDASLPTYGGNAVVRAQAPNGTVPETVPVTIPVTTDGGLNATVVNASVISITPDGVLLFDAAGLTSWSCGAASSASTGSGSAGGCAAVSPLLAQLIQETAGIPVLQKKAMRAQRECAKGHAKEAAQRMREFLNELQNQVSKLAPDSVARWNAAATAIRASLLG